MKNNDILKWLAVGLFVFALLFSAIGLITYFFTAWPETRDLRLSQNENYPVVDAVFTEYRRSNTTVNGETMYRLHFEWDGGYGRTNASFTQGEAISRVGLSVPVRVSNGHAVPLTFERSALSIIGFVFLGVFGGIGFITMVTAAILGKIYKKKVVEDM